ncbi:MAG: hypothetical protein HY951_08020 [Bacteroidia bacterium]|nr:hypothetical protein [Bacteroidia bacterium]
MKNIFITIAFLVTITPGFSQNKANKIEKTVYLYTFENLTEQTQPDKLVADVLKIKYIKEAKVNCKWESGKGQLIFVVEQEITGSENIENINLIPVKEAILNNNLMPIECKPRESVK